MNAGGLPFELAAVRSLDGPAPAFVSLFLKARIHRRHYRPLDGRPLGEVVQRSPDSGAKAGQPGPAGFARGPRDFERLCAETNVDVVYTATPWEWHVPVCLAAMKKPCFQVLSSGMSPGPANA